MDAVRGPRRRSRLMAWPARYTGHGNTDDARNFTCAPTHKAL